MANTKSKNGKRASSDHKPHLADKTRLFSFGITVAARKELRALRLEQRRVIHRAIYESGTLTVQMVNGTPGLHRICFGAMLRAAAKLERDTYVILRIGLKHFVEPFYAKHYDSAVTGSWMLLERSGVPPFNVEASAAWLINTLEGRLQSEIDAIKANASELATTLQGLSDDVMLLEMIEKDRDAAHRQLRQDLQERLNSFERRRKGFANYRPSDLWRRLWFRRGEAEVEE